MKAQFALLLQRLRGWGQSQLNSLKSWWVKSRRGVTEWASAVWAKPRTLVERGQSALKKLRIRERFTRALGRFTLASSVPEVRPRPAAPPPATREPAITQDAPAMATAPRAPAAAATMARPVVAKPAVAKPATARPAQELPRLVPYPGWWARFRWVGYAAAAVVVLAIGFQILNRNSVLNPRSAPSAVVERGPLTINVVGAGTVRPRQQIVLRNEMDRDVPIVFIVKEGSVVKEGDLLVELDATYHEDELSERLIRLSNAEAGRVRTLENFGVVTNQAQADVDQAALLRQFAELDLQKYVEGEYPKMVKDLEAKITLAEEELNRSREVLRWSQVLFSEKYLSQSNLRQDELSAKKAQLNLELATEDLMVMTNFTHPRRLTELRSNVKQTHMGVERAQGKAAANIAQAKAEVRAQEAEFEGQKAKVQRLKTQIARASIRAPIDGMVLYASSIAERSADDRVRIQQGAIIDKKGEIIYLPTAEAFDVDIRVPEVNLAKLRSGLKAQITLDALPSRELTGKILNIASLPDAQSRWINPNLKFYNTVISLDSTEITLRNGMSCHVDIEIEKHTNALYVPIQSVVQREGQPMVYLVEGPEARPVAVELGLDNNRVVQIVSGLQAGQRVLLAPPLGSEGAPSRSAPLAKPHSPAPIAAGLGVRPSSIPGLPE